MLSGACVDFISTIINHLYICDYYYIPVYIVCNILLIRQEALRIQSILRDQHKLTPVVNINQYQFMLVSKHTLCNSKCMKKNKSGYQIKLSLQKVLISTLYIDTRL